MQEDSPSPAPPGVTSTVRTQQEHREQVRHFTQIYAARSSSINDGIPRVLVTLMVKPIRAH